jgi:hypothetical protein
LYIAVVLVLCLIEVFEYCVGVMFVLFICVVLL